MVSTQPEVPYPIQSSRVTTYSQGVGEKYVVTIVRCIRTENFPLLGNRESGIWTWDKVRYNGGYVVGVRCNATPLYNVTLTPHNDKMADMSVLVYHSLSVTFTFLAFGRISTLTFRPGCMRRAQTPQCSQKCGIPIICCRNNLAVGNHV